MWRSTCVVLAILLTTLSFCGQRKGPINLAHDAVASASENFGAEMSADKAIDGNEGTRWSGIPGHNSGVWFQLSWKQPITVGQLVIKQFDRFSMEWDIQAWDSNSQEWKTIRHDGQNGKRLPLVVVEDLPRLKTTAIRIANITNGPSFKEVEVYSLPFSYPPTVTVASDLQGNFLGIVTDYFGSEGKPNVEVKFVGENHDGPWQGATTTDSHGLFKVPMIAHLQGKVKVQCSNGANAILDSTDYQYGLNPLSTHQARTSLDGTWKFHLNPPANFTEPTYDDSTWGSIAVPAHWEMQGYRSLDGLGGYRRWFEVPAGTGRLVLKFEGVYNGAEVWINGKRTAYHEGGFTPFESDITDLIHPGKNLLAVRVSEHTVVSDKLDHMSLYADFPLSGIIRKAYLYRTPDTHIARYETDSTVAMDGNSATLAGKVFAIPASPSHPEQLKARVTLKASNGNPVGQTGLFELKNPISGIGQCSGSFRLDIPNPKLWTAETPNLYILQISLISGTHQVQVIEQTIGIRQTTIQGSQILINNRPVKIRGTCHHDQDPLLGRAVTVQRTRQDMEMIKDANLNSVRTSHYPPIPELLDFADELGLYVEDEASFCWADATDDLRNAPRVIQLTAELVERDRNHPSVFMWSICNESNFGIDFERSQDWVKESDKSRPVAAATSAWLDIATLHNPISIGRIKANEKLDKPLLFDESWCIYQGIFNDVAEMWVDPGMRDYYVEPLQKIYRAMMDSNATQGSQIWAWSDDLFSVPGRGLEYGRGTTMSHFVDTQYALPGRGIVGDAPWGVVDGWRREKPEFWITKKLHSPIKLSEKPLPNPAIGTPIEIQVENQFDFLNLSDVKIEYQIRNEHGVISADIAPHKTGVIRFQPKSPISSGSSLGLKFSNSKGQLIDSYRIPLGAAPQIPHGYRIPTPLVIQETNVLAGEGLEIIGSDFDLMFDKSGGYLRRGVVHNQAALLELPRLHVLPSDAPTRPIPTLPTWNLKSMTWERSGKNVVLTLTGSYPDFDGKYSVTVTPFGNLSVVSEFTYQGRDMDAREIGLVWSVPKNMDTLDWERKAEWNIYPDDHIGRPVGTASAFERHDDSVPPKWGWSHDNSPMGSNDFRSTKRHITSAEVRGSSGAGVQVTSNGSQSLRAMVETDRISVHINDWFGGTNVGWG